jgi:hypothetical protein
LKKLKDIGREAPPKSLVTVDIKSSLDQTTKVSPPPAPGFEYEFENVFAQFGGSGCDQRHTAKCTELIQETTDKCGPGLPLKTNSTGFRIYSMFK